MEKKSDDDNDYEDNENDTDDQLFNKSTLVLYNADDNDSDNEDSEQNDHEEPTSTIISSTPIVTRRSRFVGCCDWAFKNRTICLLSYYFLLTFQRMKIN